MHLIIVDQETQEKSILCVERGAAHGQVLSCVPDMLPRLEKIAKALGVDYLRMTVFEGTERPIGWEPTNLEIIAKDLRNGK